MRLKAHMDPCFTLISGCLIVHRMAQDVSLFTAQSLQVEVVFMVCLAVGVLLALGVPCVLGTHACLRALHSRRGTESTEETSADTSSVCAVNCRKCALVLVMHLIFVLLV